MRDCNRPGAHTPHTVIVRGLATLSVWALGYSGALAQGAPTLELQLDTGGTTFQQGDPVYATLVLTNTGSAPVMAFPNLYPEVGVASVDVTSPDGASRTFAPLAVDDVEDQPRPLAPGESFTAVFPIFYGADGWTFAAPGQYKLAAAYEHPTSGDRGRLDSAPVLVTIEPDATGAATALFRQQDKRDEAALFLVWEGGDHLRRGRAKLEGLIEEYPKSAAADHARLAIGVSLSRSFRDYSIGRVRPPDYAGALEYLEALDDDRFDGYPGLQQSLSLTRSLAGVDRPDEAQVSAARASDLAAKQPALRAYLESAATEDAEIRRLLER